MPYQSRAQQRLFHHLVAQGKLAPEVAAEYDKESKGVKLPQYAARKAFGGEVDAVAGARCPACDYPLDQVPVALDAGEACPRCGFGSAKDVPVKKAMGGEVMEPTAYRARGGEISSRTKRPDEKARDAYESLLSRSGDYLSDDKKGERFQSAVRKIGRDYPYSRSDKSLIPVYNERGERTEQYVRGYENPTRFDVSGEHERAFDKAMRSQARFLREDLASRGARSGEKSDYKYSYTGDGTTRLLGSGSVAPRMTAEQLFEQEQKQKEMDERLGIKYAHGGEVCEHCGASKMYDERTAKPSMKELYLSKKRPVVDDGRISSFAKALKIRSR